MDTLESVLNLLPDAVCRFQVDFTRSYTNRAADILFEGLCEAHYTSAFIPFIKVLIQNHEANLGAVSNGSADADNATLPDVKPVQGIFQNTRWQVHPFYDGAGKVLGYQCMGLAEVSQSRLQDDFDRQSLELYKIRSEFRQVIDTVPAMIWYKDDENRILHLNKSAAESMGMSVEHVTGKNTYDLFGDAAKQYHEDDLKVIRSGVPLLGNIERFTPNDEDPRWVQTDKIPFNEPGSEAHRILVVSSDITELKEKEALLSSINQNLDDFASLTSHDLKAPLRKIGLSAEFLEMELEEPQSEEVQELLDDIKGGVAHMTTLIESFLKFMRTTPEKVDLEPLNLKTIMKATRERLEDDLNRIGATLTLPKTNIFIKGDAPLLEQVFNNLLNNAIKYRHPDRALHIDVQASRHARMWTIDICDNGTGIESSLSGHVFELFGRAKPHVGVEGDGIGLALCKRIVILHGASIEFVQTPGPGACFRLIFNESRRSDGR